MKYENNLITARVACNIARVDRAVLNDTVHKGYYPCIPAAENNRQHFSFAQVVTLCVFGRLLAFGMRPRDAGILACEVESSVGRGKPKFAIIRANETGSLIVECRDDLAPVDAGSPEIQEAIVVPLASLRNHIETLLDQIDSRRVIVG